MNTTIFSVIFPLIAAFIVWLFFKNKRSERNRSVLAIIMIIVSVVELAAVLNLLVCDLSGITFGSTSLGYGIGGLGLRFQYTGFRGIFGVLTAFAWLVTFLFSAQFMKNDTRVIRYDFFNLITLGATMGIFYAADFFTLFFFFEIMSFTSFMWIVHAQTHAAQYAAGTYLGVAIAGGMAILMGIFLVYNQLGTLDFKTLGETAGTSYSPAVLAAAVCMLLGFGAKASAFPVHVWLPTSYTQAPAPATALLSAILSKTGVFGILLVTVELLPICDSFGRLVLVVGTITMLLGGIRGVMSGNFKTTIAYSSMSQIGFILVGVGMQILTAELAAGGETVLEGYRMAVNGTLLHMINHSLVKLILFMIAGIVFMNVGSYELNKVRGFGHGKPFLLVTFLLAAAGVSGIPLLNGYISKTLLHESLSEYTNYLSSFQGIYAFGGAAPVLVKTVELLFLFSGGLTLAYMTKLFVVLFIDKNEDSFVQSEYEAKTNYASALSKLAIGLCALPIPFIGILPNLVADNVAEYGFVDSVITRTWEIEQESVNYFSLNNLSGALISIAVGIVVYILVVRFFMLRKKDKGYREIFPAWLNLEKYVYRAVFFRFIPFLLGITSRILDSLVDIAVVILRKTVYSDRPLPYELPEGNQITHVVGKSMERVSRLYCAVTKKEYKPKNYEHKLALGSMDIFENVRIIERSLSFGLFMFCVGLVLTMMYLLVVN